MPHLLFGVRKRISNLYSSNRSPPLGIFCLNSPQSTFVTLSNLKNEELRALAFRTGINSSGTKGVLTNRLWHELPIPRLSVSHNENQTNRILSVDMGIRNLAFCVLDVPNSALRANAASSNRPANITLQAWCRTAVTAQAPDSADSDLKEAFDPATYAALAYDLVVHTLLPHKPTQILLERQRYRSGGAHAVQEWTVRVNMFESMLHAVFRTLQRESSLHGSEKLTSFPEVHSVSPQKVARFYFAASGEDGDAGGTELKGPAGRKTGKIEKAMKIAVARDWLLGNLSVSEDARPIRDAYLQAKDGNLKRETAQHQVGVVEASETASTSQVPKAEKLKKLDDLADCLLQGLAWVRWEQNRRDIIDQGYLIGMNKN